MSDKLKPCPACGGKDLKTGRMLKNELVVTVMCQNSACWFTCQMEYWSKIHREAKLTKLQEHWLSEFKEEEGFDYNFSAGRTKVGEVEHRCVTIHKTPKKPVWKIGDGFIIHGVPWAITHINSPNGPLSDKCHMINLFTMKVSDDFNYPPDDDRIFSTKEELIKTVTNAMSKSNDSK